MTQFGSEEMEEEIRGLLLRDPSNAELKDDLAVALSVRATSAWTDMGNNQLATALYSDAMSVEPDNPEWKLRRAKVHEDLALGNGLHNPLHMWYLDQRPNQEELSEIERLLSLALGDYNAALRYDPCNTEVLMGRAQLTRRLSLVKALKEGQNLTFDDRRRRIFSVQESDEDCRAALDILNRAIQADKYDGESLEERAKIFADLGIREKAVEDYEAAYGLASAAPLAQHFGQANSFKLKNLQRAIDEARGKT